jgi:hypothetical protein
MSSRREEFKGLWRASANEAVPYTDDFPEALLVTPELLDGSLNQGNASEIYIKFEWLEDGRIQLTVRDNGCGIKNERRLLTWAAEKSSDLTHQNGHGLKKALTKFHQEYDTAEWSIRYRKKNKNLQVITGPFLGPAPDTKVEEIEDEEVSLMPSGTEIVILFYEKVLGVFKKPNQLLTALIELIKTRYSEQILEKTTFILEVKKGNEHIVQKSKTDAGERIWRSFQWSIERMIPSGDAIVLKRHEEAIPGGKWILNAYYLTINGSTKYKLKEEFPIYGRKCQSTSRIFLALNGRTIEPYWFYKFMGAGAPHNDYNGIVGFIDFIPDESPEAFRLMPTPATTKVSFYENCPVFLEFRNKMRGICGTFLGLIEKYKSDKAVAEEAAQKEEEEKRRAMAAAKAAEKAAAQAAVKKAEDEKRRAAAATKTAEKKAEEEKARKLLELKRQADAKRLAEAQVHAQVQASATQAAVKKPEPEEAQKEKSDSEPAVKPEPAPVKSAPKQFPITQPPTKEELLSKVQAKISSFTQSQLEQMLAFMNNTFA